MRAADDVCPTAYGSSREVLGSSTSAPATGQALKATTIGGYGTNNEFSYSAPEMVEGLGVTVSYTPSGTSRPDGTTSFALAYTGVEGLTVGYAQDDNGLSGTSSLETETMYAKYAFGSFTVGVQETEQENDGATTSDDEFSAFGITYQVSDDLTIGYTTSEREFGDKTQDEESVSLNVSYTTGGMTISAAMKDAENVAHGTASNQDFEYWTIGASFAF